jgi:hypothetical protein
MRTDDSRGDITLSQQAAIIVAWAGKLVAANEAIGDALPHLAASDAAQAALIKAQVEGIRAAVQGIAACAENIARGANLKSKPATLPPSKGEP